MEARRLEFPPILDALQLQSGGEQQLAVASVMVGNYGIAYLNYSAASKKGNMDMKVQFIKTPTGDRLAVLPEHKFNAMFDAIEDKQDIETVRSFTDAC